MTGIWTIAALFAALPVQAQVAAPLPGWMAGVWCTEGPQTDRTCELWTPDDSGILLGVSIATKSGKIASFEQARIVPVDGALVYFASPNGGPAVAFRTSASEGQSITFTNPDHDYPQRIRYWREGEALMAEISLADGSNPMRWRYVRAD